MRVSRLVNVIIVCSLSMALACNPAKQYVAQADKLAASGNYDEATSYYYTALLKKPNYEPAKIGLQQNAQKVLQDKFAAFRKAVLDNQLEPAIKQYQNAQEFYNNALKVGVTLEWMTEYDEIYNDVKHEYAAKIFDESIILINQKKFDLAEKNFQQIALLDTAYRNVSVLRMNTVLDPLYNEGMTLYSAGKWQEAYVVFHKITQVDEDFKDAKKYRDEALQKATTKYGVLPANIDSRISNQVLDELLANQLAKNNRSFVVIEDYQSTGKVLSGRGWGSINSIEQAIQAGKSLGYQYFLFTKVTVIKDTFLPSVREEKTAYESFTENIPNPYTDTYSYITKFKKVTYFDVYESTHIKYGVESALVSCMDANILFKDYFEVQRMDELHKLEFKGNVNNLYEDLPEGNYLPPANKEWRDQFTGSKRKLTDKKKLEMELQSEIAQKVGSKVQKFIK